MGELVCVAPGTEELADLVDRWVMARGLIGEPQKPPSSSIDGIRLDHFEPGFMYEVGNVLGALLLAERWAEPVTDEEPALLVPLSQATAFSDCVGELTPSNLVREVVPPYFDHLTASGDLERRKRLRRGARSTIARVVSRVPTNHQAHRPRRES